MALEQALEDLIEALRSLPGIGQRSAQRIAYHLLQHDRDTAVRLARALQVAAQDVGHCERCHTLSALAVCATCADASRDAGQLMVVETPADQVVIERTASYRGLYFVLMGRLRPLEGLGIQDLGVQALIDRATGERVREVILATSFTAEGEATAHVLAQALKARGLAVTRLARGVPAGSELEYVDLSTLAHALHDRR